MIFQTLNGNWVMNEKGSEAYIEAKVPGSVLSTLLVQHRIQDPYFGTNEKRCDFVNRISKALVDGKITNKQCNELSQRLHDKCFGAGKTE